MSGFAKGAGARAAWMVESRRVFADLQSLFAGDPLRRLDFEPGEQALVSVSAAYRGARDSGRIKAERFSDIRRLRFAMHQELAAKGPGEMRIFLQESERQGVYEASVQAIARHAIELLEYDGSCIWLASPGNEKGVLLDWEADAPDGVPYELEAWG